CQQHKNPTSASLNQPKLKSYFGCHSHFSRPPYAIFQKMEDRPPQATVRHFSSRIHSPSRIGEQIKSSRRTPSDSHARCTRVCPADLQAVRFAPSAARLRQPIFHRPRRAAAKLQAASHLDPSHIVARWPSEPRSPSLDPAPSSETRHASACKPRRVHPRNRAASACKPHRVHLRNRAASACKPRRLHRKLSRAFLLSQAEPHAQSFCTEPSRAAPAPSQIRTSLLGKHTCLAVRTRRVNLQKGALEGVKFIFSPRKP
uniref:Uncharacterized protein n=1 Tax=Cucumis melo TaxID=3656 RepID=A0A9I9EJY6_CUCME